jgi:Fe2+ or Zn2+ uptake regulation protein
MRVYDWFLDNPGAWTTKRARRPLRKDGIRVSRSTIYSALKILEHNGFATRRGGGRNTEWVVSDREEK